VGHHVEVWSELTVAEHGSTYHAVMRALDLDWIAGALGARSARRVEQLQTLWGGYGEIVRVALDGEAMPSSVIVKCAHPPARSDANDTGLIRKCRSYDVETAFYRTVAPRCDDTCRVAMLRAARGSEADREWLIVLEDLDAAGFAGRTSEASPAQLDGALAWLASFHARFLGEQIGGVWEVGTYWQLETRRGEVAAIVDPELRAAAPALAARLATARFTTLLHGDPKEANFCFARDGRVAAVDFQYTGHGCGMVDVAYLLYGRSDEPADGIDEPRLATYFRYLRTALSTRGIDTNEVETEWRALYPIARLDFCRFLAGWRPAMWRADRPGQHFVRTQLAARQL
jgi:Phosphotransferase enzyme family